MDNNNYKPQIRFKGYNDDWEQRKLGEMLSLENGYAFQSEFFVDEKTGLVVATPGNVSVEAGFICEGGKNYSVDGPCPERFIFQPGDIFITMTDLTPSANTLGKPAIVPDNGITYLHNQRLGKLVGFEGDKGFLFALLCTDNYHAQMVKTASGTTVRHSSPDRILSYEALLPKKKEQVLIGQYFSNLDKLITLHQRKYNKLVNVKKTMLDKVFPHEGEKVPEVRFEGYTDDWEQRKVQDIYKITRGYVLAAPETDENSSDEMPYPVYSSQTKNNGLMGYYRDYLYEDAITWTTDGANAGTVNYRAGKFYCTNVCGVLLSDEGYANKCAAEALNTVAWKWVSRVGNPKLMNNVMGEISISLPRSIEEQDQISKFFEEIDSLITLHQSKYEKLVSLKKSFLNKLL